MGRGGGWLRNAEHARLYPVIARDCSPRHRDVGSPRATSIVDLAKLLQSTAFPQ